MDGTVLSGEAEVNQAAMTGESEAASKREGSVVFAGTTLETGSLVIRVDAAGDQSRINNIIALIDHSEELKARIQSRAEKLADSIVPYTLLTAGALFLFTRNISKALSVLMVDYSCAIKLATPHLRHLRHERGRSAQDHDQGREIHGAVRQNGHHRF